MGRVVDVAGLDGLRILPEGSSHIHKQLQFSARIVDNQCEWNAKPFSFVLDSVGVLHVKPMEGTGTPTDCVLSVCGLASLIYGVIGEMEELILREWLIVERSSQQGDLLATLGAMFPPMQCPYFYEFF